MFSLQKFHIHTADCNNTKSIDVGGYNEAFKKVVMSSAKANFFAVEVVNMIERSIERYKAQSSKRIRTGFVNDAWSQEKQKHAMALLFYIEEIDITQSDGKAIKDAFVEQITMWGKDYLPKMRFEFLKQNPTSQIKEGSLENTFLPLILESIDIIFQVYSLYQIQDRTRLDYRVVEGAGANEAFALLCAAQDYAKQAVTALLGDYNLDTLKNSKKTLEQIVIKHKEMSVITAASNLRANPNSDAKPGINANRLLHVHKLFTEYLYGAEMKDLQSALESYVVFTKNGVLNALTTVSYYFGFVASTGKNLATQVYKKVAPPSHDQDTDDDEDYSDTPVVKDSSTTAFKLPPQAYVGDFASITVQDNYQNTATKAPVLKVAPAPVGNLIDLDDEPAPRTPTPSSRPSTPTLDML